MDTPAPTPVFCRDCKHLLGIRHKPELAADWRCAHPSNIDSVSHNLVTGDKIVIYHCTDLIALRNNSYECGPSGAWFEAYTPPVYTSPSLVPIPSSPKPLNTGLKARLAALKAEDL